MLKHKSLFIASLALAFIGLMFYANVRTAPIYFDYLSIFHYLKLTSEPISFLGVMMEWFPSLLFMLGMPLFSASILGLTKRSSYTIPLIWLLISLVLETLQLRASQNLISGGHFEWVDIIALVTGCMLSILLFRVLLLKDKVTAPSSRKNHKLLHAGIFASGLFMALGSTFNQCTFPDGRVLSCNVDPIYLSWHHLRNYDEVKFYQFSSNPDVLKEIEQGANSVQGHDINSMGKIYLYGQYLVIVDIFKGAHIFDNKNPEEPEYLAYINVPGVTDVEVYNRVMYLNSFTDIVTLKLSEGYELTRNEDLLSYPDTERLLPNGIRLANQDGFSIEVDQSKGILIGYKAGPGGPEFYFWDMEL